MRPRNSLSASRDLELASRLSFFLWSSMPDDQLLDLAEQRPAEKSCRAAAAGAAHAGRRAVRCAHLELRRAVAAPAQRRNVRRPTRSSSRSTKRFARSFMKETELFVAQHRPRRSQPARPADSRPHVRQRAARRSLRRPADLWIAVPPRDADRSRTGAACSATAAS